MSRQHFFKTSSLTLTFHQLSLTSKGHLFSRGIHCTKFDNFPAKESRNIERTVWPFIMWPENHLLPWGIYCIQFGNFHAKGSKYIELTSLLQFRTAIWPLTMWPEYLLSKGIHCTKFGNFQAKGSKYNEWTLLRLQTDRLLTERCKTICPLFFKWGHNYMNYFCYALNLPIHTHGCYYISPYIFAQW